MRGEVGTLDELVHPGLAEPEHRHDLADADELGCLHKVDYTGYPGPRSTG